MSTIEALTITVLGMSVVFLGLVLCIAFIHLSNRAARRIPWTDHAHGGEAATPAAAAPLAAPAPAPAPAGEPPSPHVLAVIAAVLEIEQRLYQGRQASRLTIRRGGAGA